MRISDGVKRYQEETKDRIFNSIIGMEAVSEETQMYSPVNRIESPVETAPQRAAVRRDWTGLAAIAACAVMAVGVGTMMMKGNAPQTGNRGGSFVSGSDSSEEPMSEAVTAEIGDGIVEEDYYIDGMTFGDLLERSYEVMDLRVEGFQQTNIYDDGVIASQTRPVSEDAAIAGFVDYTTVYDYDTDKGGVVYKSGNGVNAWTPQVYYRQYLTKAAMDAANGGARLPIAKNGDRILVFVKEGSQRDLQSGSTKVLTTNDSIYRFDIAQHKYVNIVSPGKFEDEVNEYVLDTLEGMSPAAVRRWTAYHRMSLVTVEEPSESVPGGNIIDLEWDDDRCAYVLRVSSGS